MATMLTAVQSAELTRSPQEPDPQVPERAHLRRFSAFLQAEDPERVRGLGQGGQGCPAEARGPLFVLDQRVA